MKTRILFIFLGYLISLSSSAFGVEAVTLTGKLIEVACTTKCGECCTGTLLSEKNKGFEADVRGSEVDLKAYTGDEQDHLIEGYFYEGAAACGEGTCVYFHITAIGEDHSKTAVYDSATGILHIPEVDLGIDRKYQVDLGPPFNVVSYNQFRVVQQGEDCSGHEANCVRGLICVSYYGIGGGSGPLFQTCEIPCETSETCPDGQKCVVIADGPGSVCRP